MLRRLGCTPAEVVALGVLATAAVAAVGMLWLLSQPPRGGQASNAAGVTVSPSTNATPLGLTSAEVIVHVAGAVVRPGVYTMPGGSRVGDAVTKAGGPKRKAVLDGLNLARPLTDGEQVVVPTAAPEGTDVAGGPGVPVPAPGTSPAAVAVSLNAATITDLETLPGIGPVLGQAILDHRETIGQFTEIGELRDVPGIGEKTFQALAPLVSL